LIPFINKMQTGNPKEFFEQRVENEKNKVDQTNDNDCCMDFCCFCCFLYYCCNIFDENEEH